MTPMPTPSGADAHHDGWDLLGTRPLLWFPDWNAAVDPAGLVADACAVRGAAGADASFQRTAVSR